MSRTATADRGMRAVLRVREVRERATRVALVHALDSVRRDEGEAARLRAAFDEAATPADGTAADFVVSRRLLAGMVTAVREAEHRLATSRGLAAQAHQQWQDDKARVRAVEHLLDQRAARRTEERNRAEVREVDDVVGALHSHRQHDPTQNRRSAR